jgi:predicted DNA-binding protein YlxM (UPF0122 family)
MIMAKSQESLPTQVLISELFHVYGELLSEKQKTFIQLYYDEDLSLSEIAERYQVSRQAVHDAIKHGRRTLEKYEAILHLLQCHRRGFGVSAQPGWKRKIEVILEEMEKVIQDQTPDHEGRLKAHIASLRELLPRQSEVVVGREEAYGEEAA